MMSGHAEGLTTTGAESSQESKLIQAYSDVLRQLLSQAGISCSQGMGLIDPGKAKLQLIPLLGFAATKGITENRDIPSSIRMLDVTGPVMVSIRQGSFPSLTVFAKNNNQLSKLKTEIKDQTLSISMQSFDAESGRVWISLVLPSLTNIQAFDDCHLVYSGIDKHNIDVSILGNADVEIKGSSKTLTIYIEGPGVFNAEGCLCSEASISVSGSGSTKAFVAEKVSANLVGSGQILILGSPAYKEVFKRGSGRIEFSSFEGSSQV